MTAIHPAVKAVPGLAGGVIRAVRGRLAGGAEGRATVDPGAVAFGSTRA